MNNNDKKCETCGKAKKMFDHWTDSNRFCHCDDQSVNAGKTINTDNHKPKCTTCGDSGEDRTGENPDEVYPCHDCQTQPVEEEIREAYEKWKEDKVGDSRWPKFFSCFEAGYKSQSAKIKEQEEDNENLNKAVDSLMTERDEQAEEIERLKEGGDLLASRYADRINEINEQHNQIISLRDILEEAVNYLEKTDIGNYIGTGSRLHNKFTESIVKLQERER